MLTLAVFLFAECFQIEVEHSTVVKKMKNENQCANVNSSMQNAHF